MSSRGLLLVATLALGCSRGDDGPPRSPPGASAPPSAAATSSACGPLDCTRYADVHAALSRVLASSPRVLAVGETHAQRDRGGVPSATRRFAELLLPELAPRSSALIVELWVPDPRCNPRQIAQVARQTEAVTKTQATTNQSEFVLLGQRAKQLGLAPSVLSPSCEDYAAITRAGPDDVLVMLAMIARLTREAAERALARPEGKLVITYGGALHNDAVARPGKEDWTFGPALSRATAGAYAELDLIVPEYIGDTEAWTALPWYPYYDAERLGDQLVLFHPAPQRWVLIFPRTPLAPPAAAPSSSSPAAR